MQQCKSCSCCGGSVSIDSDGLTIFVLQSQRVMSLQHCCKEGTSSNTRKSVYFYAKNVFEIASVSLMLILSVQITLAFKGCVGF